MSSKRLSSLWESKGLITQILLAAEKKLNMVEKHAKSKPERERERERMIVGRLTTWTFTVFVMSTLCLV